VLAEKLRGQVFPECTEVVDVREWEGEQDGRPHLYIDLVLSDPAEASWPEADIRAIRAAARVEGMTVSLLVSRASQPKYRNGAPAYRGA
jgi:hypothetical protein